MKKLASAQPPNKWAQMSVSNSEMSIFCSEQGRTRGYAETYFSYVAGENPRRTPLREKRAIYGWKLALTLAAIFVVCVPGLSSPQPQEPVDMASQLRQIARELAGAAGKLETISNDLHRIVEQRTARPVPDVAMAVLNLELASAQCSHASDLIWCYPDIKPPFNEYWRDYTLDVSKMKKSNLETVQIRVQRIQVKTKGRSVLDHLDKARETIHSSLPLLDKAIQLFQQEPGKDET